MQINFWASAPRFMQRWQLSWHDGGEFSTSCYTNYKIVCISYVFYFNVISVPPTGCYCRGCRRCCDSLELAGQPGRRFLARFRAAVLWVADADGDPTAMDTHVTGL